MKQSRKEAIQALERYYWTGKPCKHGHIAKRLTVDGACAQCRLENGQVLRRSFLVQLRQKDRVIS